MIDVHSHILPRMDDGSASVEESIELLSRLSAQGVTAAVATPHFYAQRESVAQFLERRDTAYRLLAERLTAALPSVLLGAEVRYYGGISRLTELPSLCIEGSRLLLLEMPFDRWTQSVVNEVVDLACRGNLTVVLAHIERYRGMQDRRVWERLARSGVLFQANAEFFNAFLTRRKALKLLKAGAIHLLGSDCHGLAHRPPRIGEAFRVIDKACGADFVSDFVSYGESLFDKLC